MLSTRAATAAPVEGAPFANERSNAVTCRKSRNNEFIAVDDREWNIPSYLQRVASTTAWSLSSSIGEEETDSAAFSRDRMDRQTPRSRPFGNHRENTGRNSPAASFAHAAFSHVAHTTPSASHVEPAASYGGARVVLATSPTTMEPAAAGARAHKSRIYVPLNAAKNPVPQKARESLPGGRLSGDLSSRLPVVPVHLVREHSVSFQISCQSLDSPAAARTSSTGPPASGAHAAAGAGETMDGADRTVSALRPGLFVAETSCGDACMRCPRVQRKSHCCASSPSSTVPRAALGAGPGENAGAKKFLATKATELGIFPSRVDERADAYAMKVDACQRQFSATAAAKNREDARHLLDAIIDGEDKARAANLKTLQTRSGKCLSKASAARGQLLNQVYPVVCARVAVAGNNAVSVSDATAKKEAPALQQQATEINEVAAESTTAASAVQPTNLPCPPTASNGCLAPPLLVPCCSAAGRPQCAQLHQEHSLARSEVQSQPIPTVDAYQVMKNCSARHCSQETPPLLPRTAQQQQTEQYPFCIQRRRAHCLQGQSPRHLRSTQQEALQPQATSTVPQQQQAAEAVRQQEQQRSSPPYSRQLPSPDHVPQHQQQSHPLQQKRHLPLQLQESILQMHTLRRGLPQQAQQLHHGGCVCAVQGVHPSPLQQQRKNGNNCLPIASCSTSMHIGSNSNTARRSPRLSSPRYVQFLNSSLAKYPSPTRRMQPSAGAQHFTTDRSSSATLQQARSRRLQSNSSSSLYQHPQDDTRGTKDMGASRSQLSQGDAVNHGVRSEYGHSASPRHYRAASSSDKSFALQPAAPTVRCRLAGAAAGHTHNTGCPSRLAAGQCRPSSSPFNVQMSACSRPPIPAVNTPCLHVSPPAAAAAAAAFSSSQCSPTNAAAVPAHRRYWLPVAAINEANSLYAAAVTVAAHKKESVESPASRNACHSSPGWNRVQPDRAYCRRFSPNSSTTFPLPSSHTQPGRCVSADNVAPVAAHRKSPLFAQLNSQRGSPRDACENFNPRCTHGGEFTLQQQRQHSAAWTGLHQPALRQMIKASAAKGALRQKAKTPSKPAARKNRERSVAFAPVASPSLQQQTLQLQREKHEYLVAAGEQLHHQRQRKQSPTFHQQNIEAQQQNGAQHHNAGQQQQSLAERAGSAAAVAQKGGHSKDVEGDTHRAASKWLKWKRKKSNALPLQMLMPCQVSHTLPNAQRCNLKTGFEKRID